MSQKYKYQYVNVFFLFLQVIFSILALYTLWRVGTMFLSAANLPTPTCPDGSFTFMSVEVLNLCGIERMTIYLPKWILVSSRLFVPLYLVSMLTGSGINLLASSKSESKISSKRFVSLHFGTLFLVILLHLVVFPFNLGRLFTYIAQGTIFPPTY